MKPVSSSGCWNSQMTQQVPDHGRIRVDRDTAAEIDEALYDHIGRLWERKHEGEAVNARLRRALKAQRYIINLREELGWDAPDLRRARPLPDMQGQRTEGSVPVLQGPGVRIDQGGSE